MMTEHERDDARRGPDGYEEVLQLLRHGDPAADGRAPSAAEVAALRRRVLQARDAARKESRQGVLPPRWRPVSALLRPAFAALLLVLLAGAGGLWWLAEHPAGPAAVPTAATAGTTGEDTAGTAGVGADITADIRSRQIQFETAGGTRIVWVLTADDDQHSGPDGPGGVR